MSGCGSSSRPARACWLRVARPEAHEGLVHGLRKDAAAPSPFDPTKARFSWSDALLWAARGRHRPRHRQGRERPSSAVFGWETATGTVPPGLVEEPPAV